MTSTMRVLVWRRRSKAVMWFGFTLLVGQWSLFYWLTWWVLAVNHCAHLTICARSRDRGCLTPNIAMWVQHLQTRGALVRAHPAGARHTGAAPALGSCCFQCGDLANS